jgi:hypothetical protein
MTSTEREAMPRYRFDPADSSGVFLGLGVVQCVALGLGLAGAVIALSAGAPLPASALPLVAGLGLSFGRVHGRPAWEWVGLLGGWTLARLHRQRLWCAPVPLLGGEDAGAAPMPPCLAGVSVIEVPWRGRQRFGAVLDVTTGNLTAGVSLSGPAFSLAAASDQAGFLSGWGELIGAFCSEGSPVAHLAWHETSQPSDLGSHRAWLAEAASPGARPEAAASYRQLVSAVAGQARAHEVILTVTVSRDRLGPSGGSHEALRRAACSAVESVQRGAAAASLLASEPLSGAQWRGLVRDRVDGAALPSSAGASLAGRLALVRSAAAGPVAVETGWDHLRVDGSWHRTYHVVSWPGTPVGPAWLEAFLTASGPSRTMTVVMVPVAPHRSRRRIERDLVKLDSDAVVREERGRRVDARHRRAVQALLDREAELVAGFPELSYVGLVSVSARSAAELEAGSEEVCQQAREAGMDLRCLYGRQDTAWAAALPLGVCPRVLLS